MLQVRSIAEVYELIVRRFGELRSGAGRRAAFPGPRPRVGAGHPGDGIRAQLQPLHRGRLRRDRGGRVRLLRIHPRPADIDRRIAHGPTLEHPTAKRPVRLRAHRRGTAGQTRMLWSCWRTPTTSTMAPSPSTSRPAPGANLIYRGDDVKPGQTVLPAGLRLTAADIGALAALGVTQISVSSAPRVAIISTGDELVPVDKPLQAGQIRDVNAPMLAAAVRAAGGIPEPRGIIQDEQAAIQAAVKAAILDCDLLLISGGTSVGIKDAIPAVISELGELLVHGCGRQTRQAHHSGPDPRQTGLRPARQPG